MTQYEMTDHLSEKCNVTLEEAKAALEAGDWNMLTATQLLDQEKFRRMQELDEVASDCKAMDDRAAAAGKDEGTETGKCRRSQGLKNLGDHVRRVIACGNRNRFVVSRNGADIVELPVTVLAALMLCSFGACALLLVIGLFAGCRYSFSGRELGRDNINGALNKAADAAEHMKRTVAEA